MVLYEKFSFSVGGKIPLDFEWLIVLSWRRRSVGVDGKLDYHMSNALHNIGTRWEDSSKKMPTTKNRILIKKWLKTRTSSLHMIVYCLVKAHGAIEKLRYSEYAARNLENLNFPPRTGLWKEEIWVLTAYSQQNNTKLKLFAWWMFRIIHNSFYHRDGVVTL